MQDFAFIDETLDRNLTHTYHLSIQADLNGLSFCILDPVTKKYIVLVHKTFKQNLPLEDIVEEINEFITSNDLLKNKKFKSTKLIWISDKIMLIPEILFSKENLKVHFEFNHQLDDLDEIHYNKLEYINSYVVFVIPNLIANIFIQHFPGIRFYNQNHVLLNGILSKSVTEKIRITVFIHPDNIDIAVTEAHKLLLLNSFKYKTDADIAYYILMLFEQFNLNGEINELYLCGNIDRNSRSIGNLQQYIKHIKFDHLPEDLAYSYTFNKIPQHMFSNLFRLVNCE
jgi:hypothetical protein